MTNLCLSWAEQLRVQEADADVDANVVTVVKVADVDANVVAVRVVVADVVQVVRPSSLSGNSKC